MKTFAKIPSQEDARIAIRRRYSNESSGTFDVDLGAAATSEGMRWSQQMDEATMPKWLRSAPGFEARATATLASPAPSPSAKTGGGVVWTGVCLCLLSRGPFIKVLVTVA